jgi:Protein of unknown function (DUF3592)
MDFLNLLPILIIGITVVILAVVFLPMIRGSMRSSQLMKTGVSAQAQILKVWQTGMYVNEQPQLGMTLQVTPADGSAPFQAEAKKVVSMVQIPQFQPGGMLEVKYDPANPKEVAIAAIVTGGGMATGGMPMGTAAPMMNAQGAEQMLMGLQSVHENIVKTGTQAQAKVVQYMPMGINVNGNNPVVNLTVEVHPATGAPFNAMIQGVPVAEASVAKYQPGQMITVRYLDQTQVAVEHSGV